MNRSDWSFNLPADRIAQEPTRRRGDSRLLVLGRTNGKIRHTRIRCLPEILQAGDLLVVNDTAVIPGRLLGRRLTGGKVEVLLLESQFAPGGGDPVRRQRWTCLVRPSRKLGSGERIRFGDSLEGVLGTRQGEIWRIDLESPKALRGVISSVGRTPLPPYIRRESGDPREERDRRRYQTIYADRPGSAAAPTAGLHFTRGILDRLKRDGIGRAPLTLHLGAASFVPARPGQPAQQDQLKSVSLPPERFRLPIATARAIREVKSRGGRVIAVGTSTTRVLESCHERKIGVRPGEGTCRLFIRPGHKFRVVDGILTNFHLPGSTHLLLVGALAGKQSILEAYRQGIESGYRFYSYGDAMLIL